MVATNNVVTSPTPSNPDRTEGLSRIATPPSVESGRGRESGGLVPAKPRQPRPASGHTVALLEPLTDPVLAPPVSRIHDRQLLPVTFRAERGASDEADGDGLSRFGARFRDVIAQTQGVDSSAIDLGLVRLAEALNANTDANMNALKSVQVKRTEKGELHFVRLWANTPMLLPWLPNGRALRRLASRVRPGAHIVTASKDHPKLRLPTMAIDQPDDVLEIVHAQRGLLDLSSYAVAGKKRSRIDSIVRFGVLEPPDVVLTQLVSYAGAAWTAMTAEGAQRLFSALLAMDALANRSTHSVATAHWYPQGHLRDLTGDDLRNLHDALQYKGSAAAGYFPGEDIATFLATTAQTSPAAVAFQLLRTMPVNLVIAVNPDPVATARDLEPVSGVIQEMIRSFHVAGKAKDNWKPGDTEGLIAIAAIDEFHERGQITDRDRKAWLGQAQQSWHGPAALPDGSAGNRLYSLTRLMALLTTQSGIADVSTGDEASLAVVNRQLRDSGTRVHADDRARVAAALAIASLGLFDSGSENQVQAALFGTFRHPMFWKTGEHPGDPWPRMLSLALPELAHDAREELSESRHGSERGADFDAGPDADIGAAQRALAALGAVALIANPALLRQRGGALSRTGLGGGGKGTDVRASDPSNVVRAMVRSAEGIDQLEDAVAALIANAEPIVPLDRSSAEPITDFGLRDRWLGLGEQSNVDPATEFARRISALINDLESSAYASEDLQAVTAADLLNPARPSDEDDDEDIGEFTELALFETTGITEHSAQAALNALRTLTDFFTLGKTYSYVAARSSR